MPAPNGQEHSTDNGTANCIDEMIQGEGGLLVLSDFLCSPLGKKLSRDEIREKCRVRNLPNAEAVENHPESYSGYINVNEREDSIYCNLFFWLFPAEEKRDEAPFILWLNGGPGSSSLKGLFAEHGAYQVNSKNQLEKRNVYLSQKASVLYLDSPVGTGFSHTNGGAKRRAKTHDDVSHDVLSFLDQFFDFFPEYLTRDFYISGESYGGKFVPALALKIHERNERLNSELELEKGAEIEIEKLSEKNSRKSDAKGKKVLEFARAKKIQLVGMTIGAPYIDPISQVNFGDFLYTSSLMNERQRKIMAGEEEKLRENIRKENWKEALKLTVNIIFGIPDCLFTQFTGFTYNFHTLQPTDPPCLTYYIQYIEKVEVRAAIHAGRSTTFNGFNPKITYDLTNVFFKSELAALISLLEFDYKILIYVSQLDILIPSPSIKAIVASILWNRKSSGDSPQNFKILSIDGAPRTFWKLPIQNSTVLNSSKKEAGEEQEEQEEKEQVLVGYVQTLENFTFIELLNAGHLAFVDVPEVCMEMMFQFLSKPCAKKFISGNPENS